MLMDPNDKPQQSSAPADNTEPERSKLAEVLSRLAKGKHDDDLDAFDGDDKTAQRLRFYQHLYKQGKLNEG